jgi:predicted nucleic-acid-binding Zn-ribbon protein
MAIVPKYTGNEICPKCGAPSPVHRYVRTDDCVTAAGQEHIHLSCSGCGYGAGTEWIALGVDAPPP